MAGKSRPREPVARERPRRRRGAPASKRDGKATPTRAETVPSEPKRLCRHLTRSRGLFSLAFVRWNHPGQEHEVMPAIRVVCPELKIAEVRLTAVEAMRPVEVLEA